MAYLKCITDKYGDDLTGLCGPKSQRKEIKSFDPVEVRRRMSKIAELLDVSPIMDDDGYARVEDVIMFVLNHCQEAGIFEGMELPFFDKLFGRGMLYRDNSNFVKISEMWINYRQQRMVRVKHLIGDLVFNYKPHLVQPATGREMENGDKVVNDAQHRTLSSCIVGVDEMPMNYMEFDDIARKLAIVDAEQYHSINIVSLAASEYDKWRNGTNLAREKEKLKLSLTPDEERYLKAWRVFNANGVKVLDKDDKSESSRQSKALTGIGNMLTYLDTFGFDIWSRAVSINMRLFTDCVFATNVSWGICEFLKQQGNLGDAKAVDEAIFQALHEKYSPRQARKIRDEVYKAKDKYCEENDKGNDASEPVLLAEGIRQVVVKYQPTKKCSIVWQKINPGKFPKNEDGDEHLRYMPPFKMPFSD
jgi:hypothetical protein